MAVDNIRSQAPVRQPLRRADAVGQRYPRSSRYRRRPWRELHHPEQPTGAEVGLPADVEGDLARILARALVQQFRADVASTVGSSAADADPPQVDALHERRANQG